MRKVRKTRARMGDPSIISESCSLEGSIETQGSLVVFGSVTGKIKCNGLEIWKDGKVYGDVEAENVSVGGYFEGEMICKEGLSISGIGTVTGKISYGSLSIESGGLMEGTTSRLKSQETAVLPLYQGDSQS